MVGLDYAFRLFLRLNNNFVFSVVSFEKEYPEMKKLSSQLYIWTSKIFFMLEMKFVFSSILFLFSFLF